MQVTAHGERRDCPAYYCSQRYIICKGLGLGGDEFCADFQDSPVLFPPLPQALWVTFAPVQTCVSGHARTLIPTVKGVRETKVSNVCGALRSPRDIS